MPESLTPSKKLQWKWVGITIIMYAVFYLMPLFFLTQKVEFLADAWIFSGIIIIAAVAAYLSKGVTIWEPAIAGAGLFLLFFLGMIIFFRLPPFRAYIAMVITMAIVFLMSLLGAWLGERAQKLWKTKSPEST
ncbi:MAG: hypothetical protein ABSC53_15635 [Bacteroidota bacterium]